MDRFKLDIEELRKEGHPLWMTNFVHESYADMVDGGGDIWSDRLYPEWARDYGSEREEK